MRKIHVEVLQLKSSQASTMEAVGAMRNAAQDTQVNGSGLDEEMKKADALIAKGTSKAKVYDELMKKGK